MNLIIGLRGHIRRSFENEDLYKLLKNIQLVFNIELYIHTWNVKEHSLSWREINSDLTPVTTETIYTYFKDLSTCIKSIVIEDQDNVIIHGNTFGNIGNTRMPVKGWKYMIYGMYKLANMIPDSETKVLFTRFDILMVPYNSLTENYIIEYIEKYISSTDPLLFKSGAPGYYHGCENLMMGKPNNFKKYLNSMHTDVDSIICKGYNHQEYCFIDWYNKMESILN
jgi:hypothetical protein